MDSFVFRNLDSEKPMKHHHHHRFPKITDLFRYMEICVVAFVLLWFSTKLPFNLNIFITSFQDVCDFLLSPRFVFVVGNAIVLTLFVKSGQLSAETSTENSSDDVYDEFVKNSATSKKISQPEPETYTNQETQIPNSNPPPETSVKLETPIPESNAVKSADTTAVVETTNVERMTKSKKYERSRSESMKLEKTAGTPTRELRRSKTEKSKEEMSNEEFQKTIEEFIARQVKFIREESMAVVLQK